METHKRLKKNEDRMIFGVCGALADYFNMDSTIVRIIFVIATLMGLIGLLFYLILAIIIPSR
ncbi:MAG: PspC domain-containing protein [Bacteroidales bacterium]